MNRFGGRFAQILVQLGVIVAAAVLVATACAADTPTATPQRVEPAALERDEPADDGADEPAADESADDPAVDASAADESGDEPADDGAGDEPDTADDDGTGAEPLDSIRDVDFRNGFSYDNLTGEQGVAMVVQDGYAEVEAWEDRGRTVLFIIDVDFGDLDGDNNEEALVTHVTNAGGLGSHVQVEAFQLVDGTPQSAGRVYFGEHLMGLRLDAGFTTAFVRDSTAAAPLGAEITEERMVLVGDELVVVERLTPLSLIYGDQLAPEVPEVKFLPGTSAGYVSARVGIPEPDQVNLEASAGQTLKIEIVDGEPASWQVVNVATRTSVDESADGAWVLPTDGLYEIAFDNPGSEVGSTFLRLSIDEQPRSVTWNPRAEETVVANEPSQRTLLTWPVFESASATQLDPANAEIEDLTRASDDDWIEYVQDETGLPLGDGSFEYKYVVTYAEDDLVSVRWDVYDYVCCLPHPNFTDVSVVVDLASGQIIEPGDMLDLGRTDEIIALWLTALEQQNLDPGLVAELRSSPDDFSSYALVDGGIELRRDSLGNSTPSFVAVVSFEDLGDLLQPQFRARLGT